MVTNHLVDELEKGGDWWIWCKTGDPPLMAHFAFEQQLSEAVGGFVYISKELYPIEIF